MPSEWNKYVKDNYHKVAHMPNAQRLKALSQMRKGGVAPKGKKGAKGAGLLDVLGSIF